ncbi:MAG TPA: peroxiredoxin, partial [Xanthomonadales bacterium]|nr:peroxiredoxin [Xanthomonadales bacterium]
MLKLNDAAPDFTLADDQGGNFTLSEHRGEKILLVFYPGDNTPVCTAQLCEYRDGIEAFEGLGVKVVGISKDDAASHQKFRDKHKLPFTLLSDPDLKVAAMYDSKGMMGMKRSIFLVDEKGRLRYLHVESLALFRRKKDELVEAI